MACRGRVLPLQAYLREPATSFLRPSAKFWPARICRLALIIQRLRQFRGIRATASHFGRMFVCRKRVSVSAFAVPFASTKALNTRWHIISSQALNAHADDYTFANKCWAVFPAVHIILNAAQRASRPRISRRDKGSKSPPRTPRYPMMEGASGFPAGRTRAVIFSVATRRWRPPSSSNAGIEGVQESWWQSMRPTIDASTSWDSTW